MRIFFGELWQDLRYSGRMMAQKLVFTSLAILSLALGIGANSAIYSFMDAILLRSLPVDQPEQLVLARYHTKSFPSVAHGFNGNNHRDEQLGMVSGNMPFPAYEALRDGNTVLSSICGFARAGDLTMLVQGDASIAVTEYVTGGFFQTMGVRAAAGRLLDKSDDFPGSQPVAIVSHAYALRRFGDAAKAVGQDIQLNRVPFTVAGVSEAGFFGMNPGVPIDLYIPMHANASLEARPGYDPASKFLAKNRYWIEAMGRLRPGVSMLQAQAAMAPVFDNFIASTAANDKERADLPRFFLQSARGGGEYLRLRYARPLYALMTMVALILAIACANIANLLLARAAGRRREMAIRLSLGAGRARIIRQLLTESLALALAGGALGIALAIWGVRVLSALIANGREGYILNAQLNWRVLAVTLGATLLTGLLCGLAPALRASRVDLTPALKQTRGGDLGHLRGRWWRAGLSRTLVVSQMAIALLLIVAAGLFARTLANLYAISTGFNQEHLLLFSVNAWQSGYRDAALSRFYLGLQNRLATIPGVRNASLSHVRLLSGSMNSSDLTIPGAPVSPPPSANLLSITPGYFETMEIPVLLGRDFTTRDLDSRYVLVNELFVKSNFGHENPIGRHFQIGTGPTAEDAEIIGVVKNVLYDSLKHDLPPTVYRPCCEGVREVTYVVRTAGDPLQIAASVRELVRQADSRIPVTAINTQEQVIEKSIGQERVFASLGTGFALLALVIACVGLYGTMAYNVSRRTGEIGIRMALGAQRGSVVWMVQRETFLVTAVGLGIGLPVAYSGARLVESLLFGMKAHDAVTLLAAPAVLLLAANLAGWGPARHASRIEPMVALRED
ncbi:MAG TPA: ABC transporter permease [Bryobacteraceae bacterium]|nr:ABC transporter permease [Bryobacteraceae bacterium]